MKLFNVPYFFLPWFELFSTGSKHDKDPSSSKMRIVDYVAHFPECALPEFGPFVLQSQLFYRQFLLKKQKVKIIAIILVKCYISLLINK
jgi:hypothetical protein